MQGLYAELVAVTSRPEDAALRKVVKVLVADNRKRRSLAKTCDKALSALMSAASKAHN
jgi:hypothetical protein